MSSQSSFSSQKSLLSDPDVEVINTDMQESLLKFTVRVVKLALTTQKIEQAAATEIKRTLEAKLGKFWHCIVGSSYGTIGGANIEIDGDIMSVSEEEIKQRIYD